MELGRNTVNTGDAGDPLFAHGRGGLSLGHNLGLRTRGCRRGLLVNILASPLLQYTCFPPEPPVSPLLRQVAGWSTICECVRALRGDHEEDM